MLTNGGHHHVFPPRTYQIADQGTARGSKSGHNHKGYSGDIAYDIGYGQSTLSEVFHEKKEQDQVEREIKFCTSSKKDTSSILRSLRQL